MRSISQQGSQIQEESLKQIQINVQELHSKTMTYRASFLKQLNWSLIISIAFGFLVIFSFTVYIRSKGIKRNVVPLLNSLAFRYIWIGSDLPSKYQNILQSFYHPYELYSEESFSQLAWNWEEFQSMKKIEKADILRMLFLYYYGGYYADFDTHCDYQQVLRNRPKNQTGCYYSLQQGLCENGFMYCSQKYDPDLRKILIKMRKKHQIRKDQNITQGIVSVIRTIQEQECNFYPNYQQTCKHDFDASWFPEIGLKANIWLKS